jgi:ABC-type nitrate/sulfonate/bicarbonate transport system substrate-binding protein
MLGLVRYSRRLAITAGLASTIGAFAWLTAAEAQGNRPLAPVTLRLDWKPGAQHAPFYFAKAKGYYAAEGLDVTIIPGSGSSDSVKLLGAHSVDVALVDALVLVQAAE